MDAFGDDPAVDPAAEFLARERADLAGLDIINGTGAEGILLKIMNYHIRIGFLLYLMAVTSFLCGF